jgi:hypothetical protein
VEALDEEEKGDFKFEREGKLAILEDVLKAVDEKRKNAFAETLERQKRRQRDYYT